MDYFDYLKLTDPAIIDRINQENARERAEIEMARQMIEDDRREMGERKWLLTRPWFWLLCLIGGFIFLWAVISILILLTS